jgi:hypothetical protein
VASRAKTDRVQLRRFKLAAGDVLIVTRLDRPVRFDPRSFE